MWQSELRSSAAFRGKASKLKPYSPNQRKDDEDDEPSPTGVASPRVHPPAVSNNDHNHTTTTSDSNSPPRPLRRRQRPATHHPHEPPSSFQRVVPPEQEHEKVTSSSWTSPDAPPRSSSPQQASSSSSSPPLSPTRRRLLYARSLQQRRPTSSSSSNHTNTSHGHSHVPPAAPEITNMPTEQGNDHKEEDHDYNATQQQHHHHHKQQQQQHKEDPLNKERWNRHGSSRRKETTATATATTATTTIKATATKSTATTTMTSLGKDTYLTRREKAARRLGRPAPRYTMTTTIPMNKSQPPPQEDDLGSVSDRIHKFDRTKQPPQAQPQLPNEEESDNNNVLLPFHQRLEKFQVQKGHSSSQQQQPQAQPQQQPQQSHPHASSNTHGYYHHPNNSSSSHQSVVSSDGEQETKSQKTMNTLTTIGALNPHHSSTTGSVSSYVKDVEALASASSSVVSSSKQPPPHKQQHNHRSKGAAAALWEEKERKLKEKELQHQRALFEQRRQRSLLLSGLPPRRRLFHSSSNKGMTTTTSTTSSSSSPFNHQTNRYSHLLQTPPTTTTTPAGAAPVTPTADSFQPHSQPQQESRQRYENDCMDGQDGVVFLTSSALEFDESSLSSKTKGGSVVQQLKRQLWDDHERLQTHPPQHSHLHPHSHGDGGSTTVGSHLASSTSSGGAFQSRFFHAAALAAGRNRPQQQQQQPPPPPAQDQEITPKQSTETTHVTESTASSTHLTSSPHTASYTTPNPNGSNSHGTSAGGGSGIGVDPASRSHRSKRFGTDSSTANNTPWLPKFSPRRPEKKSLLPTTTKQKEEGRKEVSSPPCISRPHRSQPQEQLLENGNSSNDVKQSPLRSTGGGSVSHLVQKLNSVSRLNPQQALEAIDTILRQEADNKAAASKSMESPDDLTQAADPRRQQQQQQQQLDQPPSLSYTMSGNASSHQQTTVPSTHASSETNQITNNNPLEMNSQEDEPNDDADSGDEEDSFASTVSSITNPTFQSNSLAAQKLKYKALRRKQKAVQKKFAPPQEMSAFRQAGPNALPPSGNNHSSNHPNNHHRSSVGPRPPTSNVPRNAIVAPEPIRAVHAPQQQQQQQQHNQQQQQHQQQQQQRHNWETPAVSQAARPPSQTGRQPQDPPAHPSPFHRAARNNNPGIVRDRTQSWEDKGVSPVSAYHGVSKNQSPLRGQPNYGERSYGPMSHDGPGESLPTIPSQQAPPLQPWLTPDREYRPQTVGTPLQKNLVQSTLPRQDRQEPASSHYDSSLQAVDEGNPVIYSTREIIGVDRASNLRVIHDRHAKTPSRPPPVPVTPDTCPGPLLRDTSYGTAEGNSLNDDYISNNSSRSPGSSAHSSRMSGDRMTTISSSPSVIPAEKKKEIELTRPASPTTSRTSPLLRMRRDKKKERERDRLRGKNQISPTTDLPYLPDTPLVENKTKSLSIVNEERSILERASDHGGFYDEHMSRTEQLKVENNRQCFSEANYGRSHEKEDLAPTSPGSLRTRVQLWERAAQKQAVELSPIKADPVVGDDFGSSVWVPIPSNSFFDEKKDPFSTKSRRNNGKSDSGVSESSWGHSLPPAVTSAFDGVDINFEDDEKPKERDVEEVSRLKQTQERNFEMEEENSLVHKATIPEKQPTTLSRKKRLLKSSMALRFQNRLKSNNLPLPPSQPRVQSTNSAYAMDSVTGFQSKQRSQSNNDMSGVRGNEQLAKKFSSLIQAYERDSR